ncbi:UDP-N-acetylglucosamine 2-epimerase (non-hydrolyzing) [Candidatus Parcubacteria bacterium]|nr:UDP-N-acetylglucosamine 2-epimerase (non-hydrolyzing) [Candidatus Parcubacteria bacterium]
MKIAIILGTRPEIIKMASVIRECQKKRLDFFILHTNQHYSENLDKIFFQELELPQPKYNLKVGSGTHGEETGKMLIRIEKVLIKEKPDIVLVEGDTNSVISGALAAVKLHIKVGHIEAGLRSYFREMPEEINRILTDHCSNFLFAPTKKAKEILINEGISDKKIFITGNTIVDALYQGLDLAKEKSSILDDLKLLKGNYFLLTLHRPENVDKKEKLKGILKGLDLIYKKFNLPVVYPIHPRTKKMISKFKLKIPKGIGIIEPIGFLNFLQLESNARLVLTDSGAVQEETCILKIPCVTLRDNTERPETIEIGSNILVGADPQNILKNTKRMLNIKRIWKQPFGDGKTGERIINIIQKK